MTLLQIIVPGVTFLVGLFLLLFPDRFYSFLLGMKRDSDRFFKSSKRDEPGGLWFSASSGRIIYRILGLVVTGFALFMWYIILILPSGQ